MAIDWNAVGVQMGQAAAGVLSTYAQNIKAYAEGEGKKLASCLVTIEALRATNQISEEEASLHLDLQKNASRAVFMSVHGITLIAAESAINAALGVIKTAINTELGFVLIA